MPFLKSQAIALLLQAHEEHRLAHAYLIHGPAGSGKREVLSTVLAHFMQRTLETVWKHPDVHVAEPESRSRRIVIEQIRYLDHALRNKPFLGSIKMAILHDADRLQPQAANAFLKILEEPPPQSYIFLTSTVPEAILETVTSRCLVLPLYANTLPVLTENEMSLLNALAQAFTAFPHRSPVAEAFSFSCLFLKLLNQERSALAQRLQKALAQEQAHYKKTTDQSPASEAEEHTKALIEASAFQRRLEWIQLLMQWFADQLRMQLNVSPILPSSLSASLADCTISPSPLSQRLAISSHQLLSVFPILEEMTAHLQAGVQETLAVEAGFLKLFSTLCSG